MTVRGGTRNAIESRPTVDEATSGSSQRWYLTLSGSHVELIADDRGLHRYHCTGCDTYSNRPEGRQPALKHANEHASQCRATSHLWSGNVTQIAQDVTADVRAELPRIDARAAAGIALSAAVLIGVTGQPPPMPILPFAIVAAGLLTVSVLLFFTVLLPAPSGASRVSIRRWAEFKSGEDLANELATWDRAVYHASAAIELSSVVRAKHKRLVLAVVAGALAVLTLAFGASYALYLGFR